MNHILRCYLVAGTQDCLHLPEYKTNPQQALLTRLETALKSGITCYQFREKGAHSLKDPKKILTLAKECQHLCQTYHVPFIINNDVALAQSIQADGIHVGQTDYPAKKLIKELPSHMMIGLSVHTLEQAQEYNSIDAISYYGCGPIFPTQSKSDAEPAVGPQFIHELRLNQITKPLVAIGGIQLKDIHSLYKMGANGVAIISTIMKADNVKHTVHQILQATSS